MKSDPAEDDQSTGGAMDHGDVLCHEAAARAISTRWHFRTGRTRLDRPLRISIGLMREKDKNAGLALKGTLAAFAAYGMWGFFPLFWKQMVSVESFQILAHRMLWASLFCVMLMAVKGRLPEILQVVKSRKKLFTLMLSAIMVTINWGLYIWAVNSGRVTESALGYYINPLFSVALGVLFFGEKADLWTKMAVSVAAAGIIGAAIAYGSVPWVSLFLAFSFAVYGALKKRLGLEPLLGLTVETLMAVPFILIYLVARHAAGAGSFLNSGALVTFLLVFSGFVTAIPLLFFAFAANSIRLQEMGFVQYVSPTCQLFLGVVVFGEKLTPALIVAFIGVIFAVLLYIFSRMKASQEVLALKARD
ncbi:MAG: EamA family transporter RarD [Thermoleophilia bacterium]